MTFEIDRDKVHRGIPFKLNDNGTDAVPFTDGPTLPFLRDAPPPLVTNEDKEKDGTDWLGAALDFTNKQFNFGADLLDGAITGYNKIGNDFLRNKYHKLSKLSLIKWKSGEMFQTGKSWAKVGTKLGKYFGPAGTLLSAGMVGYEVGTGTWDAHTIVDGAIVVVAGAILIVAIATSAPIIGTAALIMTGIAAYGMADYTLDISGALDSWVGRDSGLWD